jgi:multimeric flavodoxin WrbA
MTTTVIGIVGSYRRGRTIDRAVSSVLEGAAEGGAETRKFHLLDEPIGFCSNCRSCMQAGPELRRGACVQDDAMGGMMDAIDAADAVVFGAPINMGSTTALMKRFLERLAPYSYWPWGQARAPVYRVARPDKAAVLVTSAATPGPLRWLLLRGAMDPLNRTARSVGAAVTDSLYLGGVCPDKDSTLPEAALARARTAGARLARRG